MHSFMERWNFSLYHPLQRNKQIRSRTVSLDQNVGCVSAETGGAFPDQQEGAHILWVHHSSRSGDGALPPWEQGPAPLQTAGAAAGVVGPPPWSSCLTWAQQSLCCLAQRSSDTERQDTKVTTHCEQQDSSAPRVGPDGLWARRSAALTAGLMENQSFFILLLLILIFDNQFTAPETISITTELHGSWSNLWQRRVWD